MVSLWLFFFEGGDLVIIIIFTHKPMCSTVYTIRVMGTNTYFKNETLLCNILVIKIYENVFLHSASKHLHELRLGSVATCLLGLRFESHNGKGMSVSCEFCVLLG